MPETQPKEFSHLEDESPAFLLGEWLRANYVIEDGGNWLYTVGSMPDDTGNRIVLTDTTPIIQARSMRTGRVKAREGVQIRTRSTSYQNGYRKLKGIQSTLELLYREQFTVANDLYMIHCVSLTSGLLALGKDERERWNFTLNVTLNISQGV